MLLFFAATALTDAAIPYRTTPAVPAGSLASSLVIVGVVLVALVVAAVYARRRGWIAKLGVSAKTSPTDGMQVNASCRLSMNSTAYVLRYKGKEFLVVECARGTNATIANMDGNVLPEGVIQ